MATRLRPSASPPTASENQLQSAIKNPAMKWLLIIAGAFLVVLLGIGVFKAFNGEHVKIFGIEFNSQKPKTDTIYKEKVITESTLEQKDSSRNQSKIIYVPALNPQKEKHKDTSAKTNISGNNNKTVIGSNSGIVGDVTINNGQEQRHLTQEYGRMLLQRINDTLRMNGLDKNVFIQFGVTMGSDESLAFTNEVAKFLIANGFKNFGEAAAPTIGHSSLFILYSAKEKELFIDVGMKPPK